MERRSPLPVAVVTGATSGIGEAVAHQLAASGHRIVVVSRDVGRCEATAAALRAAGGEAEVVAADLSTRPGCDAAVAAVRGRHRSVRLLVNNAGAIYPSRSLTEDGHERTFALNVLAPYRLALGLARELSATGGGARVVNVASAAHRGQRLDLDDLEGARRWGSYRAYGRSKLALILLTAEMGRLTDAASTAFFSVHPGLVRTHWGAEARPAMRLAIRLGSLVALSPERAARTVVYAATHPALAGRSGLYIARQHVVTPSRAARDAAMAARLFQAVAAMADG